jgi:hypothetical protein
VSGAEYNLDAARWSLLIFQEILARVLERPHTAAKLWAARPPNILGLPHSLRLSDADVAAGGGGGPNFIFLSATVDMEIVLSDPSGTSYNTAAGGRIRRVGHKSSSLDHIKRFEFKLCFYYRIKIFLEMFIFTWCVCI